MSGVAEPYSKRRAPAAYNSGFFDIEHQNIQRAVADAEGSANEVNVSNYIRTGDANDAVGFQRAHDFLVTRGGGGKIRVPSKSTAYDFKAQTVTISGSGIAVEFDSYLTIVNYSGTTYAFNFDAGGTTKLNNCEGIRIAVNCTNPSGSGIRGARMLYGKFQNCYVQNGQAGTTGTGYILDGTGSFCTNMVFFQCRASNFLKGFSFQAGASSEIVTGSSIRDCFVNGQAGQTGTIGAELIGTDAILVTGGNMEILDYGVKLVTSAGGNPANGTRVSETRMESILVADVLTTADSTGTVIEAPAYDTWTIVDAAPDTVIIDRTKSQLGPLRLRGAAPTVAAGQIGLGGTTATTVGAAGGASALPATPLGYLIANVAGTQVKIPYYNN